MHSLVSATANYNTAKSNPEGTQENRDYARTDIVCAAKHHISNSHITRTYASGSAGRLEVVWQSKEARYLDWGNDVWLYAPNDDRHRQHWQIQVRHPGNNPIIDAMVTQANRFAARGQMAMTWTLYWQILFITASEYCWEPDVTFDLHINPWSDPRNQQD